MSEEVLKLPMLKIKDVVLFPNMLIQFFAAKTESKLVIDEAKKLDKRLFVVNVSDDNKNYGTIANIKECKKMPDNTLKVTIEGLSRGESIEEFLVHKACYAEIIEKSIPPIDEAKAKKYKDNLISVLENIIELNKKIPKELLEIVSNMKEIGKALDTIAINMPLSNKERNSILKYNQIEQRAGELKKILYEELDEIIVQNDINDKVIQDIKRQEKEFLLKKQLEKINEELGFANEEDYEIEEYKKRIEETKLNENIKDRFLKELNRFQKLEKDYLEKGVIKNYLETILDLPYYEQNSSPSIDTAAKNLDKEHYGLNELKERILEYLAVNKFKDKTDNMVLCLVGPPGVGKTSIAISIAKSLGRNYARIPLGGMKDEAELRGHRRTYVGAMPGKIINAFIETKSTNPVIIFDEIDKVSSGVKGDPYAVLLEIFDYEQNNNFKDYYLDVEFDISNTLFICTANSLETIPMPLLDRMEIIFLDGYTDIEKREIVKTHLIPIQNKKYQLKKGSIVISENAIMEVINYYTKESGIRELTREIEKIYRKSVKKLFTGEQKSVKINTSNLEVFLGEKKYNYKPLETAKIGEIMGLAWTIYGGKILKVQTDVIDGVGQFRFTGKIGMVMNESAVLAHTYLRINAEKLGIDPDFYKTKDIYIHIPEGAIAKDGPSAGITLLCAMLSAMKNKVIDNKIAMTGEMTIKGDVLAVGGLKEKIAVAIRNNITKIILPEDNRIDIEKIYKDINNNKQFVFVKTVEEVLKELDLI